MKGHSERADLHQGLQTTHFKCLDVFPISFLHWLCFVTFKIYCDLLDYKKCMVSLTADFHEVHMKLWQILGSTP